MPLHMIKLCVGCDTVEELLEWRAAQSGPWILRTRQTPKRAAEMVEGGSLYRVYKGVILSRQRFLEIRTVGEGVNTRCEALLDEDVVRVAPTPRRAFQGWRYLDPKDAPPDLAFSSDGEVPTELARQLREAGAW
jgi:hypothetical protein